MDSWILFLFIAMTLGIKGYFVISAVFVKYCHSGFTGFKLMYALFLDFSLLVCWKLQSLISLSM